MSCTPRAWRPAPLAFHLRAYRPKPTATTIFPDPRRLGMLPTFGVSLKVSQRATISCDVLRHHTRNPLPALPEGKFRHVAVLPEVISAP